MEGQWVPDPSLRHRLRFWDGQGWTPWVADQRVAFIDEDPRPVPSSPLLAPRPPSSGWYADPWQEHRRRYWDGERWTERSRRGSEFVVGLLLTLGGLIAVPSGVFLFLSFYPGSGGGDTVEGHLTLLAGLMVMIGVLAFIGGLVTTLIALVTTRDRRSGGRHRARRVIWQPSPSVPPGERLSVE